MLIFCNLSKSVAASQIVVALPVGTHVQCQFISLSDFCFHHHLTA